jgi:PAS domain S-box-containing protein
MTPLLHKMAHGSRGPDAENDTTFENAAVGIAYIALNGLWLRVNPALSKMMKYPSDELAEWSFLSVTHPDDLETELEFAKQLLLGEIEQYVREKRYRRGDGTYIWARLTAGLKRDEEGRPEFFVAVIEDISERKKAEAEKAYIIEEQAHRSRNMLSVISALVSLLAPVCGSAAELEQRLLNRLGAISLSNDELLSGGSDTASLERLVLSQARAFLGRDITRIAVYGDDLSINAGCAQALSLALYELMSNALKYGALCQPDGRIEAAWTISGAGDDMRFRFEWREISTAPCVPPGRSGFGMKVLESMTPLSVRGHAERSFGAEGIVWTLDAPLSAVIAQS